MEIITSVSYKVINLFFVMLIGVFLRKRKILDEHSTSALSALLVNITSPFLVICAFQKEYTPELVKTGFAVFGLSVVMHLLAALIGKIAFRFEKNPARRNIFSFGMIFANCAFLGYPVLMALCSSLGDENGLFYGVFFTLFFNMFCWTYGVLVMNDGKGLPAKVLCKKVFLHPGFISALLGFAMFMLRIKLPVFISEGMAYIGDMTFPLSMLIVGSLFCNLKVTELIKDKTVYLFMVLKLILFPTVMIFVCKLVGLPLILAYVLITMCSMPAASNTAIMADYYGADKTLAAKCVSMSTAVSVITIPLMIILATVVLG